jgi:hypothetical protein
MFPVPNVVSKPHVDDGISQVEAVKVEPKGVHNSIALVHDEQNCRRLAATSGGLVAIPLKRFLDRRMTSISLLQFLSESAMGFLGFTRQFLLLYALASFFSISSQVVPLMIGLM